MKRIALLAALLLTCTNTRATTIPVANTADSGPGSLREALASAADSDVIDASGVAGTITLTSGELLVSNSVTIAGPGPANLAIDGNLPNTTNRIFHITNSVTVVIAGLTIANGSAGIYNDHATLTISNCLVTGNHADFGAGIFNDGSSNRTASLTIINSHLSGNSAVFRGGGAYNWGGNGTATLQIVTSTLASNSANFGGGIFNDGEAGGSASLQIAGSTLSDNSGFTAGGGIYNDSLSNGVATLTVTNSSLTGNSTTNSGGAIYYFGASAGSPPQHVVDSAVNGNSAGALGGGIYNDGFFGGAFLTITRTTLSNNSAGISGGALFNDGESGGTATVQIVSGTVVDNSADFGGAIYNDGFAGNATSTITNSTLTGNSAGSNGGVLFNDGESSGHATVQIVSSALLSNSTAGNAGGIYNDGEQGSAMLAITGSHLGSNTSAADGGVIYNDAEIAGSAMLQITSSTVSENSSDGDGGAILNDGTENGTATVTITSSLVADNSSAGSFGGGAIYNWGVAGNATLQIGTSTLFRNTAVFGGAIFNDGAGDCCAVLQIASSTLSSNSADLGGAIYNDGSNAGSATLEIGNTILDDGTSSDTFTNDLGTVTSRGYNLASDTGSGRLIASTDQINTDPMLGPLQDNGGPTLTHALLPGSPAIDKGKRNTIAALASNTDQRGLPRPVDDPAIANAGGGDGSDIGAYEEQTLQPQAHDLAVIKLKAPKKITFKSGVTSVTGKLSVSIQNKSTQDEVIPDFVTLQNLLTVSIESLGDCPSFAGMMVLPKKAFPLTIAPKKKLTVAFTGVFDCVNDPLASSKTASHADYRTVVQLATDETPGNDICPRPPSGTDPGCGAKTTSGALGADVLTDIVVK